MFTVEAIDYFGSAAELSRALRITKAAVSAWGEVVPHRRALQLEKITRGKLRAPLFDGPDLDIEPYAHVLGRGKP